MFGRSLWVALKVVCPLAVVRGVAVAGLAIAAMFTLPSERACAQPPDGRNEVHSQDPAYQSTRANAPVPAAMHLKNEGGSDGSGLCVISSIIANGQYQGVPGVVNTPDTEGRAGKGSALWRAAKNAPGGYGPDKLANLVDRVMPNEKYASFLDSDPAILDKLSREGYPIGITMNTGELYNWSRIAHMVSNVHFDSKANLACHVDNNKPGVFTWTSAQEALRRAKDNGQFWAWIWTRPPSRPHPLIPGDGGGSLFLCSLAGAIVIVATVHARRV